MGLRWFDFMSLHSSVAALPWTPQTSPAKAPPGNAQQRTAGFGPIDSIGRVLRPSRAGFGQSLSPTPPTGGAWVLGRNAWRDSDGRLIHQHRIIVLVTRRACTEKYQIRRAAVGDLMHVAGRYRDGVAGSDFAPFVPQPHPP